MHLQWKSKKPRNFTKKIDMAFADRLLNVVNLIKTAFQLKAYNI